MNKNGFISMYALVLLQITLTFSMMMLERIKTSYISHTFDELTFVEIKVINKVKQDLLEYEEEDSSFEENGFDVELVYDDVTCYITIKKGQKKVLSSRLEFDDIEEEIIAYEYLE